VERPKALTARRTDPLAAACAQAHALTHRYETRSSVAWRFGLQRGTRAEEKRGPKEEVLRITEDPETALDRLLKTKFSA